MRWKRRGDKALCGGQAEQQSADEGHDKGPGNADKQAEAEGVKRGFYEGHGMGSRKWVLTLGFPLWFMGIYRQTAHNIEGFSCDHCGLL